jgi:hypothetical protein
MKIRFDTGLKSPQHFYFFNVQNRPYVQKIKNCHLKHVEEQEASECLFFKQGFCYNGPNTQRQ